MNDQLQNYIKQMHEQGFGNERIKQELLKAGWTQEMIDAEMGAYGHATGSKPAKNTQASPPKEEPSQKIEMEPLNGQPAKKNLSKTTLYLIAAGVLFVLGTGGAFGALYTQAWNPSWNPFGLSPEEILAETYANTNNVDVMQMQLEGALNVTQDKENSGSPVQLMNADIGLDIDAEGISSDNMLMAGSLKGELGYTGVNFKFDLDFIYNDSINEEKADVYFKIKQFPFLALLQAYAPEADTQNLLNKWLYIEAQRVEEADSRELIPAFLQDSKYDSYSIEYLGKEELSGEKMHKFIIAVPLEELYNTGDFSDIPTFAEFDIPQVVEVNIWVDAKQNLVRKFEYSVKVEPKADSASSGEDALAPFLAQISQGAPLNTTYSPDDAYGEYLKGMMLTLDLSADFTYPGSLSEPISPPEAYQSFEELDVLGLNSQRARARDTKRIGDTRQAQIALEIYFDDNRQYPLASNPGTCEEASRVLSLIELDGVSDPLGEQNYFYGSNEDATSYVLGAGLENSQNRALSGDKDSTIHGCDCSDPFYCVSV